MKVEIWISKESTKGLGYWVKFVKDDGQNICPYMTYALENAIHEANAYGEFFEVKVDLPKPNERLGLTEEMIQKSYEDYKKFSFHKKNEFGIP